MLLKNEIGLQGKILQICEAFQTNQVLLICFYNFAVRTFF